MNVDVNFSQLLNEMIPDICNEFNVSVKGAIKILAKYYDMTEKLIKTHLKSINSEFTANNNIICMDGDRMISRTLFFYHLSQTIKKIGNKLKNIDDSFSINVIITTLKDEYGN